MGTGEQPQPAMGGPSTESRLSKACQARVSSLVLRGAGRVHQVGLGYVFVGHGEEPSDRGTETGCRQPVGTPWPQTAPRGLLRASLSSPAVGELHSRLCPVATALRRVSGPCH